MCCMFFNYAHGSVRFSAVLSMSSRLSSFYFVKDDIADSFGLRLFMIVECIQQIIR